MICWFLHRLCRPETEAVKLECQACINLTRYVHINMLITVSAVEAQGGLWHTCDIEKDGT